MDVELNNYTAPGGSARMVVLVRHAGLTRLLFLFALLSPGAWADIGSFYGEEFIRKGKTWLDARATQEVSSPVGVEAMTEKSYREQLEEFEAWGGPYAENLSQPLLGLGRYYAGSGDYDSAISLFQRALHIVRLNEGLYSEFQAPFVRELLDTVRLTGDLEALDDRYDYFFRLYGNGQPPFTSLRMRASLEYLRWQREAIRLGMDVDYKKRLLKLYKLNEILLEATWASASWVVEDQWKLTLSQIRNLYLLRSMIEPRITVTGSGAGGLFRAGTTQGEDLDFDQRQLENLHRGALKRGVQILERYIAELEAGATVTTMAQRARAALELADWYQWTGSRRRASESYASVVRMLVQAGENELLQLWFSEPVELPDNGAFWQPSLVSESAEQKFVTATFDVSGRGRVKNLSIEETGQSRHYGFKRELGKTRFRPRYSASAEPRSSENLKRDYLLYD